MPPLSLPELLAHQTAINLESRYTEDQRHYHTLRHLDDMLRALDELALTEVGNRTAVELAVWFHDYVYFPTEGAPSNESESIKVWEEFVHASKPALDHLKEAVAELIRCTIKHELPPPASLPPTLSHRDTATFLNLDIGILAASEARYKEYAQEIRMEYRLVGDEAYRKGRTSVLRGFLERRKLFFGEETEEGKSKEARSRKNLRQEIERLSDPDHVL